MAKQLKAKQLMSDVVAKMGRLIPVINQKPKQNACEVYIAVRVENCDGRGERTLLFTQDELKKADHRSKRNPEDQLAVSKLRDFMD